MGSISYGDGSIPAMEDHSTPLAIIGMATRFPQEATNNEELWKFLLKGRSAHSSFPEDRIHPGGHYHPDPEHGGTFAVKGGHFLSENPANFDAPFFNITRGEVMALDPQQRVVLENVYHALENAGLKMRDVTSSNTSVYVSGFNHDHLATLNTDPETTLKYKPTGTTNSLLSNRVSWFFDFKAPSLTLDTACSSSMVALHLACQSLKTGESDMSVVSGVTMISFPTDITSMGHHGFLSPDGKCYSFDHRANGYARGEGVGSVIVKRLSDAILEGNTIRAVIRGTGVNQDGRTPGISLPSSAAQESLMRKVYASAGLNLEDTMMVEAHGTGTAAGDPIEASAIARTFSMRSKDIPLFVGAIKSGIGHLEGGAGIAGVIKGVLILENGIIPPNVNFEKANPKIPLAKWKIQFPTKNTPWPTSGLRRISINSFGVGGTNAHTILDDAYNYLTSRGLHGLHNTKPRIPTTEEIELLTSDFEKAVPGGNGDASDSTDLVNDLSAASLQNGTYDNIESNGIKTNGSNADLIDAQKVPRIITLTAFDEKGVQRIAKAQADYLKAIRPPEGPDGVSFLDDFAYTMTRKRSEFPWRSYFLAANFSQLVEKLSQNVPKPLRARSKLNLGFVFTGQGAQWHAMGRELMIYPIFRQSLETATAYMKSLGATWSLLEELLREKAGSNINQPFLAHPACTALQVALVDLLEFWGVEPARVVGHSSGEIAAAYCAGRLGREAAWKVAYFRGYVSQKKSKAKGAMLAVGLSEAELKPYLQQIHEQMPGELIIACFNSPRNNTISGDEDKVDALKDVLISKGAFARKLMVTNAYHSAHMKEVANEYLDLLGNLAPSSKHLSSKVEIFSSVTGARVENNLLDATYWVENLVQPVRFMDALTSMCFSRFQKGQVSLRMNASASDAFTDVLIEVGPHAALQSVVKETLATKVDNSIVMSLSVLSRSTPGLTTILETVATLSSTGYPIDLHLVNESWRIAEPTKLKSGGPKMLVNLPPYSFNHSEGLLYESRLSKNYRLRKYPRHDLFGAPVADWNAETPRWRHILRLSEQPWIRDHVVTGAFVYPGVGYLVAAIEASRQIADQKMEISGFRLRDVSLKRALIVPDNKEGVEVSLSLTRMDESSLWGSSVWKKFQVSSYNPVGDDWIEHCTGYISVDYETAAGPIDNGREADAEARMWKETLETVSSRCVALLDIESIYDNLVTTGLTFGPLFKNLSNVRGTAERAGEVFGTVTVPNIAEAMPAKYAHEHLIHPATMDSMMHFFLASAMDRSGKRTLERPMVPTFIKDVWVSAKVSPEPTHQFYGYGKCKYLAYDKYEADVMVWDAQSNDARISIKGIRSTPLESAESESGPMRKLCHEIEWTPYLELLTSASFKKIELMSEEENLDYKGWINKLQLASLLMVTDALDELKGVPPAGLDGHLLKYFNWMNQLREWLDNDNVSGLRRSEWEQYNRDAVLKAELFEQVIGHNADGKLAIRMGSNIVKVLRKEVDPLDLMFGQDNILDQVYEQVVKLGDLPALQRAYLSIVKMNCTNLNILEVGAGTGSSTSAMLESLSPMSADGSDATSSINKYTFTDISSAFFEKAREKFKSHGGVMEFKILDAEKDVIRQGFESATYDLIVAGNVVHATADLRRTLGNLRKLLKPGGRLILHEGVRQDFFWSSIAFGQLPGWWLGTEPIRQWSPWITIPEWNRVLRDAGFSGIDLNLGDRQNPDLHTQSLMVATAVGTSVNNAGRWDETVIVTSSPISDGFNEIVRTLKTHLEHGVGVPNCRVVHYLDLASTELADAVCISVVELERTVLQTLSEEEFENIRQMLSICKGLLWVMPDIMSHPEFAMVVGLLRTVRWERDLDEANLITLSISDSSLSPASLSQKIGTLYKQQFDGTLPLEKINGEYMLKDGVFLTSRLANGKGADEYLASKFSRPKPVLQTLQDAGRPIKLATAAPGLLDRLEWVTDPVYDEPLGDTQVEIDIKAVALNFRDLMIAMGEHMAYSLGNEAAGTISRVGSKVQDFKVGDRVVYMCGLESTGCFHTFGRVDQNVVVHIPDTLSYEIAASLPCVYSTVIYGLVDAGRLMKGEKILIHAAAGGVGQAAINFSQSVGAEIFCTVSSPEKQELLMREYGIPRDHIFSSRDLTFVKGIMRATNQKGVDIVLNSLSGEALRRSWDLLAPFGRFVEIGKKDAQANGKVELNPFLRNVTMTSVELPTMMRYRPALIKRLTEDTIRLYIEGKIKEAVPTNVMSFSQITEGLRILQSGKGMGKMVFMPKPDDVIPIVPAQPKPYQLRGDASYVLAGGLGGIGRSVARWMVERGARNLIFLSRTGKITEAVEAMTAELKLEGCDFHIFTCDVGDKSRLKAVLDECKTSLPPIKGLIQGAMTLKDGMFENMNYETFQLAVKPKVQGSWNLHDLLPRDMDFFILLSSATGVLGNRSQANYAAGNTYQDFLAQYRRSIGLPASTIDLGTVLSVGYVAENREKAIVAKHLGTVLEVIREDEIHILLEYLMDPRCAPPAQLVSGLTNAATYRKRGVPPPTYLSYPLFTQLRSITALRTGSGDDNSGFVVEALLNAATTLNEAAEIVTTAVCTKLSSLLAIPLENVDPNKSVSSNGVDSLVAMEFRTYLAKELKADIPLLDIMGTGSVTDLCRKIASISKAVDVKEGRAEDTQAAT